MGYIVNLPVFEGPFDLLYHLVKKQEIDIWSISIAEITAQYLDYIRLMEEFNLEIASDFLVMAATLLRLKSKLLLPDRHGFAKEEEDAILSINSSEELIRRVLEYREFKAPVRFLRNREEEQQKIYFRSTGRARVLYITRQESFLFHEDLAAVLLNALERKKIRLQGKKSGPSISMVDEYLIKDRIKIIMHELKQKREAVYLDTLFNPGEIREIIVTFMAVLELAHRRKIRLWQQRNFGPVLIELNRKNGKERTSINGECS